MSEDEKNNMLINITVDDIDNYGIKYSFKYPSLIGDIMVEFIEGPKVYRTGSFECKWLEFDHLEHFEYWVSCVREAYADAMKMFAEADKNEPK